MCFIPFSFQSKAVKSIKLLLNYGKLKVGNSVIKQFNPKYFNTLILYSDYKIKIGIVLEWNL